MMANTLHPLIHTHSPTSQQANTKMPLQLPHLGGECSSAGPPSRSIGAPIPGTTQPYPSESSSFSNSKGSGTRNIGRRKSAGLPTHLNLHGSGYGYGSSTMRNTLVTDVALSNAPLGLRDAMSILLIPLPFYLASQLLQTVGSAASNTPAGTPLIAKPFPIPQASLRVIIFTAFTMTSMGLGAKLAHLRKDQEKTMKQPKSLSLQDTNYYELGRLCIMRCMSIALPFLSISCLGGLRVVIITLSMAAGGIPGAGDAAMNAQAWKRLVYGRKWLLFVVALQLLVDLTGMLGSPSSLEILLGYTALLVSNVTLPSIYSPQTSRLSNLSLHRSFQQPRSSQSSDSTNDETNPDVVNNPLVSSSKDADLTLVIGGFLGLLSFVLWKIHKPSACAVTVRNIGLIALTATLFSLSFMFTDTRSLIKAKSSGAFIGSMASLGLSVFNAPETSQIHIWSAAIFVMASYAGSALDRSMSSGTEASRSSKHSHRFDPTISQIPGASRITNFILPRVQDWPLLHTIIKEKDSRRIFYFMCLNFSFMIVQTFYGIVSGSLGLLSDSIHMFFDCLALIVGLCAAVMGRWPPSTRFPYGYAKIETLAGFANGIFLMLISIEIIYEAIERLSEGTDVKRLNELMTVSVMGLVINIVGILAFGHAHHGHDHSHGHSHHHEGASHNHSHHHDQPHEHVHQDGHTGTHHHGPEHHHDHHHGHSLQHQHDSQHGHDHTHTEPHHSCHDHAHEGNADSNAIESFPQLNGNFLGVPSPVSSAYGSVPATPSKPPHGVHDTTHKTDQGNHSHAHKHDHKHSHDHHHHSENMMGIYLHVLGDTLGSLAVVVSTWLVQWNGWSGWDPVASTAIAIIIFGTAIPLVKNCARKLLLTVPEDVEYDLREALAGLSGLRGVVGCTVPKFWIQDGEQRQIMGTVHVLAEKSSNLEDVKDRSLSFLTGAGLNVLVQVEREGSSRCWCQASK